MDQDVVVLPQRLLEIASLHLPKLDFEDVLGLMVDRFFSEASFGTQGDSESLANAVCPFAQGDFHVSLAPVLDAPVLEQELPLRCQPRELHCTLRQPQETTGQGKGVDLVSLEKRCFHPTS